LEEVQILAASKLVWVVLVMKTEVSNDFGANINH